MASTPHVGLWQRQWLACRDAAIYERQSNSPIIKANDASEQNVMVTQIQIPAERRTTERFVIRHIVEKIFRGCLFPENIRSAKQS
nr:hypothetical protein CFP56_78262 [Quercus suber]